MNTHLQSEPPPGRVAAAGTPFGNDTHVKRTPDANPVTAFKLAMRGSGLEPPEMVHTDGTLRRFGRRSACWYVLHLGANPHGAFGDWRSGLSGSWSGQLQGSLSAAELALLKQQMREQRRQQLAQVAERHARAALRARSLYNNNGEASASHPYLRAKCLPAFSLRAMGSLLLVPLFDQAGVLHSLQTIGSDGRKRFLAGSRKHGLFCPVGWKVGEPLSALVIAEGWATAAACHLLTSTPAAAALDAGNLLPVAQAIRQRYPLVHLTFAADHDGIGGGIGTQKVIEAARAVGNALVTRPKCAEDAHADFADTWAAMQVRHE